MNDRWFEQLARATESAADGGERAPAKLKSRIYSALVNSMAAESPLLSLTATKAEGRKLCIFEHALELTPVGDSMKERNPCRVCHARILGEGLDHAPIFWRGCPYSDFHNG